MLLKVTKQLDQALYNKLRESYASICNFNSIEDSSFLSLDLAQDKVKIEEYTNNEENSKFLIEASLKNLENPSHKLEASPANIFYYSDPPRQCFSNNDLFFLLKLKLETAPVITLEIIHNDKVSENTYYWAIPTEVKNPKFKLREFVAYFFYRKAFYAKIQEILETKQKALATILGKAFATDFSALFSAKRQAATKVKVPKKTLAKELILRHSDKAVLFPASLYLGGCYLDRFALMQEISFFLGKDNKLLLELVLSDEILEETFPILTETTARELKNDKRFEAKLNKVAPAWLKDYIAFANFNAEIYDKIKTKILLEKI